ncbi:MAG: hypothetical protein CR993_07895 [Rhodobacterales bacterium]|nr:MAG: hypothetical protein CR993_07895 [Rhodobacterales bacterium]
MMKRAAALTLAAAAAASPAAAQDENPFAPGDLIVPFRHMVGGDFVRDDNDRIIGRVGFEIIDQPGEGYEGTCWRVTSVGKNQFDVELVSGIFRPHWEDGAEFTEWTDSIITYPFAPYPIDPTDYENGIFSSYRKVESCP